MTIEYHQLLELVPYDGAWFLLDRVLDWESGRSLEAERFFSAGDPLVRAHFKAGPSIVPGVLLIEAIAQGCFLLNVLTAKAATEGTEPDRRPEAAGTSLHFLSRVRASFSHPVFGGSRARFKITKQDQIGGISVHRGLVLVDDVECCRVELLTAPAPAATARADTVLR